MVILYDEKNIDIINNNLDKISNKARKYALENKIEPSLKTYNKVINIIKNYIEKNKRVIYGGYAYNELIINKNKDDRIYSKDGLDLADIEFYSFEPIRDLVNIGNELKELGYKNIVVKSAMHLETFTLFVDYFGYCDASYMPANLFHKMPLWQFNKLKLAHPKFILIDILRMYNDPINSYWRIEKNFKRAIKLLKYYPLETKGNFSKILINNNMKDVLNFVRKKIIIGSKLLVFGYYAYDYYKYKATNEESPLYVPYYDVISTDLKTDAQNIYKILTTFSNDIEVKEYHPFFQFLDSRISFEYKGKEILNIYGHNCMCIPFFSLEKKKINIVTYPYLILMLLIKFMYLHINNNKEFKNYDFMLENIINLRNEYLKKNNKTVLDNTPFEEFRIDCLGDTIDQVKKRFTTKDSYEKKKFSFKYDIDNPPKLDLNDISFRNLSGNLNNTKNRLLD
tara:strand:+ start:278 stop:1633 length:1356 start_codon:yes stop_codon:yes gene_type:complete